MAKAKLSDAPLLTNDDLPMETGQHVFLVLDTNTRFPRNFNVPHIRLYSVMSIDTRTRRARLRDNATKTEMIWTPGETPLYRRRFNANIDLVGKLVAFKDRQQKDLDHSIARHAEWAKREKATHTKTRAYIRQIAKLMKCDQTNDGGTVRNVANPSD